MFRNVDVIVVSGVLGLDFTQAKDPRDSGGNDHQRLAGFNLAAQFVLDDLVVIFRVTGGFNIAAVFNLKRTVPVPSFFIGQGWLIAQPLDGVDVQNDRVVDPLDLF